MSTKTKMSKSKNTKVKSRTSLEMEIGFSKEQKDILEKMMREKITECVDNIMNSDSEGEDFEGDRDKLWILRGTIKLNPQFKSNFPPQSSQRSAEPGLRLGVGTAQRHPFTLWLMPWRRLILWGSLSRWGVHTTQSTLNCGI